MKRGEGLNPVLGVVSGILIYHLGFAVLSAAGVTQIFAPEYRSAVLPLATIGTALVSYGLILAGTYAAIS